MSREIVYALIDGVRKAIPQYGSERDVTTVITRPLWRIWNVGTNSPPDSEPTPWLWPEKCNRVYGSETIVVESEKFEAVSFVKTQHQE